MCKGRIRLDGHAYHALKEPTSLITLELSTELFACKFASVKIEGRQRSPSYVGQVCKVWRQAIRLIQANAEVIGAKAEWMEQAGAMSEGYATTLGAYHRKSR
ncbi:putative protease [Yersinia pseudotuberculosis]|nr:putative protease [Yersinia pseudotuberculosis]